MRNKLIAIVVFFICIMPAYTHVGSPGVIFEGQAGKYDVMVNINPPDVIPGTALVTLLVESERELKVSAKPVYWFAGYEGTPKADELLPVKGESGKYRGIVWMMNSGSSSVEVTIDDGEEISSVFVPVMAIATAQKEMEPGLGYVLAILAALLVAIMITIVASSASTAMLKPGELPDKRINRKKWFGAIASIVVLALLLFGGKNWWDSWAEDYNRYMYKPMAAKGEIIQEAGKQKLIFKADEKSLTSLSSLRKMNWVIPDHGKLMHMFMIRKGTMDVFAHLHPTRIDSTTFETTLPNLPSGRYYIFADITRVTGFAETLVDTVDIPEMNVAFASLDSVILDKDDTFMITNALLDTDQPQLLDANMMICGTPGSITELPDGSTAILEAPASGDFVANELYKLTFLIQDPDGEPAELEPYLGMMGHAVIMREDAGVFIHLHPVGNYSMGSQQVMEERFSRGGNAWAALPKVSKVFADSIDQVLVGYSQMSVEELDKIMMGDMVHDINDPAHEGHSVVAFPYAFPEAGKYRIWLQFKRNGRILNAAFDTEVKEF